MLQRQHNVMDQMNNSSNTMLKVIGTRAAAVVGVVELDAYTGRYIGGYGNTVKK